VVPADRAPAAGDALARALTWALEDAWRRSSPLGVADADVAPALLCAAAGATPTSDELQAVRATTTNAMVKKAARVTASRG
jgi:hypothetical protein